MMRIMLEEQMIMISLAQDSVMIHTVVNDILFLLPWFRIMRRMLLHQKEGYYDRYEGE